MRVWFHALPSVCVYVFATFLAFHEACGERGTENKRWRARMVVASRMERRSRRCREVWPRQESRICSVFRSSSSTSFAFPPSLYLLPPSPLICFDLLLLSVSLSLSLSFSPLVSRLSRFAFPPPPQPDAAAQGLIYRLRVGSTCQLRNVRIVYGNNVVLARRCVGFSWRGRGGGLDLCLGEVVRSKVGASRDALCQDLLSFRNKGARVTHRWRDNFDRAILLLYIIRYLPVILKRNRFFHRSSLCLSFSLCPLLFFSSIWIMMREGESMLSSRFNVEIHAR